MNPSRHPLLLEINTRCWVSELQSPGQTAKTLADVPDTTFERWAKLGFTHVWLMGVWNTGQISRQCALDHQDLRSSLSQTLPDWTDKDVGGSPFATAGYRIPASLGGSKALAEFRTKLHQHGMKLLLDFIPNHVGLDHPWLKTNPEFFVQTTTQAPETFLTQTKDGPIWIAHGKDPNFPAWTDTAQLDFRRVDTQRAVARSLESIANQCDGVRCDMAMLMLRDVFEHNWSHFPLSTPPAEGEFWLNVIRKIRQLHPDFLLLAEVYWDLEARLQDLGFDYTYDKRLYDYLTTQNAAYVRRYLLGSTPDFIAGSAHFLENHDEPPIAGLLEWPEHRASAVATLSLPGLRLINDGQLLGHPTHIPVQLRRRPQTPPNPEITAFYEELLLRLKESAVGSGKCSLVTTQAAWPDNPTHENFLAIQWQSSPSNFDLVVVNLAPTQSQCYVNLEIADLSNHNWLMKDQLGHETYQRYGDDLQTQGLYLDVPAHAAQLFHFSQLP